VLGGGVGGSRFLRGMRAHLRDSHPDANLTAIVNTGDDLWLAGLRITPDLDTILYTLAGINDAERGWGRVGETERVSAELAAWGIGNPWFTLGDLDLSASIARTAWLREGVPLHEVVARLQNRWPLGLRMLPATDDEVETHVIVDDPSAPGSEISLHFQEWWTRYRASLPALRFEQFGIAASRPAPGVLESLATADVVVLAPSNPVVSIGTILGRRRCARLQLRSSASRRSSAVPSCAAWLTPASPRSASRQMPRPSAGTTARGEVRPRA
jgi:LPPG:FO 2-phospho-L-lactate transferase